MSIYYHVHVGPVLVCKYSYKETVEIKTVTYNGCTNPECKHSKPKHELGKAKFCPQCGNPTAPMTRTKEHKRKTKTVECIYDLMSQGGFREDRFDDCWGGTNCEELIEGCDTLAPDGLDEVLGRKCSFEANEFALHMLGTPDVAGEIAKVEAHYAKEIAYLQEHYDTVTVEWVVLTTGK